MFKNFFKKHSFLEFSGSVLESKRAFGVRMVKWGTSYHLRTNSKNSPLKPLEIDIFSVLSLFSHLPLPKMSHAHPHKNYIFKINKDISITSL